MKFPTIHPTLFKKELTLKKISSKDMDALQEIVDYHPTRKETAKEKLFRIQTKFVEKTSITWGIYIENELLGAIGFYRGFENEIGEVGYVTREKFRRKGYTLKAIQSVVNYGFEQMKLKGIVAYTSDWNEASIKLLEKSNFKRVETDHPEYIKFEYER